MIILIELGSNANSFEIGVVNSDSERKLFLMNS